MLSQVTSLFLIEFAVGTLVFMLFMPLRDLKNTFFALNGAISFLFLLLYLILSGLFFQNIPAPDFVSLSFFLTQQSLKWLVLLSLVLLTASYLIFLFRGYLISRLLLLLCAAIGLAAVFTRGMTGISASLPVTAQILSGLSLVLGALLIGVCYGTMILGHWYLVTPSLPFKYLVNSSRCFVGAALLRAVILIAVFFLFFGFLGSEAKMSAENLISFDQFGLFFLMRVFWGILGPLVLSFMILETAKIRSNQAATGILYVACIFVFIGELFADYLFQMGGFPS